MYLPEGTSSAWGRGMSLPVSNLPNARCPGQGLGNPSFAMLRLLPQLVHPLWAGMPILALREAERKDKEQNGRPSLCCHSAKRTARRKY
jgi:hypothetical protein